MKDEVLAARLAALEQNLKTVETPSSYRDRLKIENADLADEVWGQADQQFGKEVGELSDQIDHIRQAPSVSQMWQEYAQVYQASQELFRECLELLGGLAFREKLLDESIYQVADELIRNCRLIVSSGPPSLAVPGPQEVLARTVGGIIRLRFPEWTIWTLPFAGHAYGHVVIDMRDALKRLLKDTAAAWLTSDAQLADLAANYPEMAARRAELQVGVLLADAFATYTMGPAYPCAGILLRFDPSAAGNSQGRCPPDCSRAYVVLRTLKEMNCKNHKGEPLAHKPHQDVIERLEEQWAQIMTSVGRSTAPDTGAQARLDELVVNAWKPFSRELGPAALYPPDPDPRKEGWQRAIDWSDEWLKNLDEIHELAELEVSAGNQLRTALNVAWRCRLFKPEDADPIAAAAGSLCKSIIKKQKEAREKGGSTQSNRGPRRRARLGA